MSYTINFDQISNAQNWYDQIFLEAADDGVGIDAIADNVIVNLQVMSRLPRGGTDQSQRFAYWPLQGGGIIGFNPTINISTNDGTGQLTLTNGLLQWNVPSSTMNMLLAGFYSVSITMKNADVQMQIAIGLMPVFDSSIPT